MDNNEKLRQAKLPLLALRGITIFPNMVLQFDVGRAKSVAALRECIKNNRKIFLVAQKDVRDDDPKDYEICKIGVVSEVRQILKTQNGSLKVFVEGIYRAKIDEFLENDKFFEVNVTECKLTAIKGKGKATVAEALVRTVKDLFEEYSLYMPQLSKDIVLNILSIEDPVYLCEYIASNIVIKQEEKQKILEESNPIKRLEILMQVFEKENSVLAVEREIQDRTRDKIDRNQRDYYLREQMKIISEELGEQESPLDECQEYRDKITALSLEEDTEKTLLKEVDRLSKMPYNSSESGYIRNYLDTCIELPWKKVTKDKLDLEKARKVLDKDHFGMVKVKERIIEMLAVRCLSPDIKGQIICLQGPPGVGKTSIVKSVAKAMGRKYVRVSLGGVRDEADIRGHRKTYVGAMPGRIMNAVKLAGTKNPVILLDEIDKMSNDFKGDPASAMLEVLDSEQNNAFRDHYLEVPFDLSEVLFITTANVRENIPAPLLDRMELIQLTSYTREEKFNIAKKHLVSKQIKKNGLTSKQVDFNESAIYYLIDFYTREAGVRVLEREIATLCRKAAKKIVSDDVKKVSYSDKNLEEFLGPKKYRPETILDNDEIGVVTGLAWTSVGGETMQIEVSIMDGTGKIELTGSLGDVMKESAKTAISYVRTRADEFSIDKEFYKNKDIHIHAPEGAIPKDGPSAGVTMTTAIVSALTGIPVRREVAMTGEVTLRGRVLTIGGLKEKTMAAYRCGVKTVIIPKDNVPDLAEVEEVVKQNINFVSADNMDIVLKTALCYMPTKKSGNNTDDIGGVSEDDKSFIIPNQDNAEVVCIKN